ncbi:IS4 family transposase [uncultured Clostridium sp.]|uniref:IS4 family transposase n=1 Tax=uncultured Clostridium sp. TaxID=59620 RepID=UPI0025F78AA4|nr:IS4 family transposase [uncultured Clostridium sp.]
MAKLSKRSIFRKITKLIDGKIGRSLRKAKDCYKSSKIYTGRDHILSMLFIQLSNCNTLRDAHYTYKNSIKLSKEFKLPSYSQLSRLNKNKDSSIFSNIFSDLLEKAEKEIKSPIEIKKIKDIQIIDSSVICISKALAPELYYQDDKSSVRISTLFSYGTKLPHKINIVPGKIGERNCIDNYTSDENTLYLFDKGYYKYSWYDDMSKENIRFVTRQPSNAVTEEYSSRYTGIDNLYDYTITLGTNYSKNKTKHKYREILYFENDSDEEFRLVTNIFDLPAQYTVSLYKKRWDIELFFKWIKQHLTIKSWLGHNLNSIIIQIYSALIIYILLLLIKKDLIWI